MQFAKLKSKTNHNLLNFEITGAQVAALEVRRLFPKTKGHELLEKGC